jgi:cell shape-determining protein MreC
MDFFTGTTGILAVVAIFVILPKTVLDFIGKTLKHKRETELEKIHCQKEILELEVAKQNNQLRLLEAENRKYDAIIAESESSEPR